MVVSDSRSDDLGSMALSRNQAQSYLFCIHHLLPRRIVFFSLQMGKQAPRVPCLAGVRRPGDLERVIQAYALSSDLPLFLSFSLRV